MIEFSACLATMVELCPFGSSNSGGSILAVTGVFRKGKSALPLIGARSAGFGEYVTPARRESRFLTPLSRVRDKWLFRALQRNRAIQ
jgi:hypothetical protein